MTKFITIPATKLDPKEVLSIENAEQRAEVIKKLHAWGANYEFNSGQI